MKKFYALPLVFLLFLTANALAQGNLIQPDANGIIYVNSAAAPGGDGSSWANAIPELADALKWARQQYDANSNFSVSIYIAKGTYKPLYNAADGSYTTDGGRNNAFVMLKHLQLYGGFPNTGNPGFDDRDWNANPTILSGDIGTIGDNSDNTYHVVISSGPAGSARLNGLTISGGNANNAGATVRVGGLYLVGSFGGGVFNLHSSPFIENTKILNNSAQLGGGGMFNSTSSPTIRNATISNNNSRIIGGGGMFNREASPAIINTIFSNNHTNGAGGGMYNFTSSSPIILNTLISYNSAQQDGGGMYNNISSSPTIVNTTISNNSAGNLGGGMTNYKASPIVENSIIFGNRLTDGSVANISNGDPAFSPVFKYSLIGGATTWNASWGTDGGNNIATTINPFKDTINGDFSLLSGTAAINGGSNSLYGGDKDLAGNNRVYDLAGGGIIDMGAYEYQGIPVHPDANGIVYVNSAAAPGGDGSSWANAIPELADALKWARQQHNANNNWLQNSSLRIYIAKGTYKPLYNAADGLYTTDGGRDNAFVMVENVQLYGGFPNTGNPGFDDRDWKANPTILSGDIGTANNNSDNTYHVVISAGDVGSASLNGVTISGGNADGTTFIDVNELGFSSVSGGGMHNNSSSITILNTTISNNSAQRGGGMFNRYSSPTILNTTISNNSAQDAGGMHNQDSSPTITNTIISNNSAQNNGGGMHNSFSSPTITNTLISNNHSGDSGGGMINGVSSPTILNTTISNNSAQTVGGGMYNSSSSSPVVNNSIVFGNSLTDGSVSNISKEGPSTTPVFKYSLIGGATSWNAAWGTDGGNNIVTTSNPFVDIANGDFSLMPSAAAINSGSNALYTDAGGDLAGDTDLAGNARVFNQSVGGIVDMGAYEFQGDPVRPDAGGILYVDIAAAPGGDGSSWAKALPQLSDALHFARDNASFWESASLRIYVAKGTYLPEYRAHDNRKAPNDRNNTFMMVKNVQLYGGYPTGGGVRNPAANPTVLSGDIGTVNDTRDNAHHVVLSIGDVGNALLDGFTITRGNATGNGTLTVNGQTVQIAAGGGIYNLASDPVLTNLIISGNTAASGGGMINVGASPQLINVAFAGNSASSTGGGIRNFDGSDPVLTNVTIAGNTAGSGGGMANNASSPSVNNSILYGNTATTGNNIINAEGSAIASRYSLMEGSSGWNSSWGTDGGGNIITTTSPFVDIAAGNYRMTVMSPAVNAGSGTLYANAGGNLSADMDLAGNPRVYNQASGGIIDMGTYEFQGDPVRPDADGILYVDITTAPGGDGSSWAKALPQLSDALHFARDNATAWDTDNLRIYVAKGTYFPEYRAHDNHKAPNDRNNTFMMVKNVQLYGGYPTGGGVRNPAANPTVLSGDIGTVNNTSDNAHHVVISIGDVGSALLNGFTITRGNATGNGTLTVNGQTVQIAAGGGIYNLASDPVLTNLIISGNTAASGGGMINVGASPQLINVAFAGNTAGSTGGGIRNFDGSDPVLTNVTIAGNTAGSGGGMANNASSPSVNNSILFGNTATTGNNIINAEGSAIASRYSLMEGSSGWNSNWGTDNGGNIITTTSPFVDLAAGNYRMTVISPAVNAGSSALYTNAGGNLADDNDLTGQHRVYNLASGGIIDMGAYEFQGDPVRPDADGILYVDIAAAPGGDGSSWAKALPQLSDALHFARDNASFWESASLRIYVAKGTYLPEYRAHDNRKAPNDRNNTFMMVKNVQLFGGFDPAAGAGTMDTRNWAANPTILSGDIGTVNDTRDNAHHVVISIGDVGSALLNGFTITRGNATGNGTLTVNGQSVQIAAGGGIYNLASDPALTNLIISGNTAESGGGMYNIGSSPHLTNAAISGNSAGTNGGGIRNFNGSDPVLTNVTIAGNTTAGSGGGMANNASSPSVNNSILYGNTAATGNNIINAEGSAITFRYSLMEGNNSWDSDWGTDGGGNIITNANPFADTANGDFSLASNSPAINTGNNSFNSATTDLANNPRIFGAAIDMGAYEDQRPVVIHPNANGIMYVDSAAAPGGDGSSWATALASFDIALASAEAVNAAAAGSPADSVRQIWVAKGTYQPLNSIPFLIKTPVRIYGGFAGTEQSLSERNLSAGNRSILKGNDGSVVGNMNSTGLVVLDGFEVTGGNVSAGSSGGIGNSDGKMIISNCIISNNFAGLQAGGIGNDAGDLTVVNSVIINNTAEYGGGIYNNFYGKLRVINCVFANNTAKYGGAVYIDEPLFTIPSISNSILWGNTTTADNNHVTGFAGAKPIVTYSIVEGGYTGTGNLDIDPQFVDPAARNYRLPITSPGINTGLNDSIPAWNSTDLAGNPRIYDQIGGGIVDMGAYEYQRTPVTPGAGNILYVNQSVSGGNGSGDSWANAVPELADALKWARQQHDADNNWLQNDSLRIFIAKGTYEPLYNAEDGAYTTDGSRDNAFVMVKNVKLYGGFPDTGNPGLSDRDWDANPTILSGDIGTADDNSDNTYHVVVSSGDVGNAGLNGLVISGGNANGSFFIDVNKFGVSRRNGGGILNSSSSPTILNTSISNNSARYGGGIGNSYSNSSPTILNTSISNNSALNGGGMYNLGSSPTILNTIISNNVANYGGGISNSSPSSSPIILNTTISNNSAEYDGGGMYNDSSSPVVNNSIVFGNRLADASVSNILNENASTPVFKYSLVGGAASWNTDWGTDGGNNIATTSNPLADTANADFSLKPGAAAINGGSNTLYTDAGGDLDNDADLAGNARVYALAGGGIVDMGAYEYQGTPVTPGTGNILYVNQSVSGGNGSGDSWANAVPELADALKWARQQQDANNNWLQNDSLRIFIAKGTYTPLYSAEDGGYTTDGGRDNAFVMVENVQLYGGFPDTGNPGLGDRDWDANPTVLSGDIGTKDDNSDNSYHVVVSAGDVGNAGLNGLILSGGNADGENDIIINGIQFSQDDGGGMFNINSSPTILSIRISNNSAENTGGGMFNDSSSPIILNTTISNNSAEDSGGGIGNYYSSPTILNTTISNNSAIYGGGMYNIQSSPTILNTMIPNNSASYGGGMGNSRSSPTILNTTISNNSAQTGGGGMYNFSSSPALNNSIVFGNRLADVSVSNISNVNASTPVIKYSLVGGAASWDTDWGADGGNNIVTTSNPFADMANADFSLKPGAAAINGGSNTLYTDAGGDLDNDTDLAGNARVYDLAGGGIVDMGAYEYQGTLVTPGAGNILYVNQSVSGGNGSGDSWANAIPELADALKWARQQQDADGSWLQNDSLRIFIAKGTYTPLYSAEDGSYTLDVGRENAFVMVKNVQLYGGFPNTGDPGLADRDWNANPTILSGDIGTTDDSADNTYHVVVFSGDAGNAGLNGLIISGGNADVDDYISVNGSDIYQNRAGGMYINNHSSPTISNTTISNNSANNGGGMINYNYSSPTILNTIISNNSALYGGGMSNYTHSSPTISNTTISNNSANNGGGMNNFQSSPAILNTTISNNLAQTSGGGIYNDHESSPAISNSIIFGNKLTDASVSNIANSSTFSVPVFKNNLVGGATSWNAGWGTDGGNNIVTTTNPFADTANGDFSLIPGPAVNGGSNALYTNAGGDLANDMDLAGNARVFDLAGGGTIDMGAYEFQGACPDILIAEQPLERSVCIGTETSFSLETNGGDLTYQWQFSSNGGTSFIDLQENTIYSGVATATLTIAAAASETAGLYRCVISNECSSLESEVAALRVTLVEITGTPPAGTVDAAYNFAFSVSGGNEPYTWSVSEGGLPDWLGLNTETGEISGTPENAGEFQFTLQADDASGCSATLAVNLIITPGEAPVITFPELEAVVYGSADFLPGASASGDSGVDYISSDENVAVITSEGLIRIVGAGITDITASLPEDPNYDDATPVTRELVVNPATLTVTANDDSKTYNGAAYSGGNGVVVTGWQYEDTDALLEGTVSYSGSSQGAATVGQYEITPSGYNPLDNYIFNYQPGILTIIPEGNVVINFPLLPAVTYGAPNVDPAATSSDDREVKYTSSDATVALITAGGLVQIVGTGTTEITASLPEDPNYDDATPVTRELVVNPATLTVTANDDSKTYNGAAYSGGNGVTVIGWQYEDTDALLEGTVSYSGSSQGAATVGQYEITPSGYNPLDNYIFNYQPGILTIIPEGNVVINFPQPDPMIYGAPDFDPAATSSDSRPVQYSSSDETVAVITSGGLIQIIGAGTTDITASLPEDPNYEDATPVTRRLVVNPAILTVTANDDSKAYDGTRYSGGNGVIVNGWQYDDTDALLQGTLSYSGSSQGAVDAGAYQIIPSGYQALKNYLFGYRPGILTIAPAGPAVITFPEPAPLTYGAPNFDPAATSSDDQPVEYTSSDENVAVVTASGLIQIIGAGTTEITAFLPEDPNHENAAPVTRQLIVNPATLTVTASDDSKTYDGLPYSGGNGVAVSGWQYQDESDADAVLQGDLVFTGSAQGATDAGTYPITPSGYSATNYEIVYQSGTLRIGKAPLVVTAEDKTRKFGQENPVFTVTYGGFVTGENETALATLPVATTTATQTAPPGDYPISLSGAASGNYDISYVSGTLTIIPATRSLVFDALPEKTYGDADFDPGAQATPPEPVLYSSSDTEVARIVDGKIHIVGAGTAVITAALPVNPHYENAPSIDRELLVRKAPQTIDFARIGDVPRDAGIISLDVFSASGLPVTLTSSDEQVAVVDGQNGENQLVILRLGTSTITATQEGNENYLPAQPVSRELHVIDPEGRLVKVHPVVSPNSDGINEFLLVEGIRDYPQNKMTIVNRNGVKVFEIAGYDNSDRVFKGLANTITNYDFLPQGTYFYLIEINTGGRWKRETGWFVMKFTNN